MVRLRFDTRLDAGRPVIAATSFTYDGEEYDKGDPFPIDGMDPRQVSKLHGARRIDFAAARGEQPAAAEPEVRVTHMGGGIYDITAPWLDKPIRLKGKDRAEAEAQRLGQEGAPLGYIEGGSDVTVEDVGGGWFAVSAPWLAEPEKIQGRNEAETRQSLIDLAGEPDEHHGVALAEGENGWWTITRPEHDGELKIQGEEAAREAATKLRAGEMIEGQPAEWVRPEPLKPGDVVLVAHEGSVLNGQKGTLDAIDGDQARVVAFQAPAEEGADQKLIEDTVPLSSLTLTEPDQPETPPAVKTPAPEGGEPAPVENPPPPEQPAKEE